MYDALVKIALVSRYLNLYLYERAAARVREFLRGDLNTVAAVGKPSMRKNTNIVGSVKKLNVELNSECSETQTS